MHYPFGLPEGFVFTLITLAATKCRGDGPANPVSASPEEPER